MFYILSKKHYPFGPYEAADKEGCREYVRRTQAGQWGSIRSFRSNVPQFWVDIIENSLEPDPKKRFQSAAEIRNILASKAKPHTPRSTAQHGWYELGIKVVIGEQAGHVFPLEQWMKEGNNGIITIGLHEGRNPEVNHISIRDRDKIISRQHALIEYSRKDKKWFIRDGQPIKEGGKVQWKRSSNGTKIRLASDRSGTQKVVDEYGIELHLNDEILLSNHYLLKVVHHKNNKA